MVKSVWYCNGWQSHVILLFKYHTLEVSVIQMNRVFGCLEQWGLKI